MLPLHIHRGADCPRDTHLDWQNKMSKVPSPLADWTADGRRRMYVCIKYVRVHESPRMAVFFFFFLNQHVAVQIKSMDLVAFYRELNCTSLNNSLLRMLQGTFVLPSVHHELQFDSVTQAVYHITEFKPFA